MKIFVIFVFFLFFISISISSFAQEEYQGTQKFLSGVAAEYDKDGKGFEIEYMLEGELDNFVFINSTSNSITFEYDSKGIEEDVLIIFLPVQLIYDPLIVHINGEQEPRAIRSQIGDLTRMLIPLYEDSKTITIQATQVISKEPIDNKILEGSKNPEELNDNKSAGNKESQLNQEVNEPSGGGCLIATATYGSELAPQVQQLREIRDNKLLKTEVGTYFIHGFNDFYYSFSPAIADYEHKNPTFKETIKIAITPMISSLSILNNVDIDSEASVLGYGLSLLLLNIGMYVGMPITVIVVVRKKF